MNLKTIIHFSIGPIGAAVLSLATLPFVAWFFSVEDVGRLTMLQVVLGLSVSLFSLAMHQAYVREYNEVEDKDALLKLSILPGLFLLIIVTAIIIILPFSVSNVLFNIDSSLLTFLLVLGIFCSFFINFLAHVIRMQERGLAFSATQIAPKAFLLLLIGLILLLNLTAEFSTLMLMNTLAIIFSLLIFALLTKNNWVPAIRKNIDRVLLKKMVSFSLPLVTGGIAYWGLTTMDRFFLKNLAGFDELGVYALSVSLAGAVSVISSMFSNFWHPILYKWVKDGVEHSRIQRVIDNMTIFVAFIWSICGLLSFVLPWLLPVEYQAIEYLIVACVSMPLFYMLSQTTGVGIGITRRSKYAMFASIFAFVMNAILNYLLIPKYGAGGAALASVIAFFIFFIVRTESSAFLWFSFARGRVYFLMTGYVAVTSSMVLTKATYNCFSILWGGLFVLTILMFHLRLRETVTFIAKYIRRRS